MKHRANRFRKESEREGHIFSTIATREPPAWMSDRELLPKEPPKAKPQPDEDDDAPLPK